MNRRVNRGKALRVAVCLLLVAALSGCMQLNMGLTVNADDTVDGQLLLTAEKSVLASQNKNIAAAFAELRQNIPALPAGEETGYEDDKLFGSQISYRRAPLAGFDTASVKLVRDGDLYRFTLPLDPSKYGGKVAQQNPQQQQAFLKLMSFEISVTFPGRVIDSNGAVNGRSVSWKVDSNQDKPTELRAVAEAPPRPSTSPVAAAGDDGGIGWPLIVGGVLLLLLLAAGGVLLLRRRRPTAPAAPGPTSPGPTSPGPTPPGPPAGAPGPG
ncbi:LppM family (lipo)protein [Micromonospora sp. CA-240977]|uniref:LppM family (lipo)protein n=1 Tax=Micromonospora sp. CA-240977 TaxID=3239957 RepID=UPI003D90D2D4